MNPKIMMLRDRETGKLYTGMVFNELVSTNIFVIENVYQGKGQCMIEHSPEELARVYDVVMYKRDFDLIAHMAKAFKSV